jgi:hypothetical protein
MSTDSQDDIATESETESERLELRGNLRDGDIEGAAGAGLSSAGSSEDIAMGIEIESEGEGGGFGGFDGDSFTGEGWEVASEQDEDSDEEAIIEMDSDEEDWEDWEKWVWNLKHGYGFGYLQKIGLNKWLVPGWNSKNSNFTVRIDFQTFQSSR